ncbi:flavocytochrome c [Clostridium aciditolerans]|uniref:Urocanate reductase n=1 Tax=Clostridium aciditolerans TaxID=339861 RepID=A0A934M5F3_9CLOT|nr:flavocytochrome c [Clostridium aciditolerans]MBI6875217.1 flavocytochrome c [Clostridium aciditolerans]
MKHLRKVLVFLLVGIFTLSFTACGSSAKTFEGQAKGKNGTIKVKVTIKDKKITKIDVVENHESEFTKETFKKVIDNIIAANSTDIDAISGATITSSAIIAAVADAVKNSGIELTAKNVDKSSAKVENTSTDVVIVGAGGAGLTAAISAKEKGANVILIEKTAVLGGNTNFATGGLNAAGTKYQEAKGIKDSPQLYIDDTMKGGKNKNNPDLVKVLAEKSADTVNWLTERGADLSDVGIMGGLSVERTHRPKGGAPVGNHIVEVLSKKAKDLKIDIRTETKATELIVEGNKVVGVKAQKGSSKYDIKAKAVVLTTGGFGANLDMVAQYDPKLKGFPTTNAAGATGDAFKMVEPLNVALVDMDQIQIHPSVVPGKSKLITEAVRGNGAILVNKQGKRFVNELGTRDAVSAAILSQEDKTGYVVFDENVRKSLSAIEGYIKEGVVTEANSVKELADKMKFNSAEFEKTINTYNASVQAKKDAEFGRADMKFELNKPKYYAIPVQPAIHHTMGGLKINTNTQVINKFGQVVEGLFAAGEVTGGVHGANRLGGNAVADITVFGRIAGDNAAQLAKK